MKLKIAQIGCWMFLTTSFLYGQNENLTLNANRPTENASNLGRFGQVPVNLSTGQPNINIPLYTVTYGDISVPISMSYNASGVRVDQHPTWTGMNWSLNAGGVITRVVHGLADDYYYNDPVNSGRYGGAACGYLFCGSKLNVSDWYTSVTNMSNYALAMNATSASDKAKYLADGIPDDYAFNFGNYSGTFFIDEKGIWRIHSQSNLGLTVTHEMNSVPAEFEPSSPNGVHIQINRMITKFTVSTPDGTRYVFGGDLSAMDYSRPVNDDFYAWSEGIPTYYNILPTAWYLTEIIKPTGEQVSLAYDRGLNVARYSRSNQGIYYGTGFANITDGVAYSSSSYSSTVSMNASLLTPCYLTAIITPTQRVDFARSLSTEQVYDPSSVWYEGGGAGSARTLTDMCQKFWANGANVNNSFLRGWPDFALSKYTDGNTNPRHLVATLGNILPDYSQQLNTITVSNTKSSPEQLKKFTLSYTNTVSTRLFLNGIFIQGSTNGAGQYYIFDYYNKELVPNYASWKKDQWGYYNNVDYTLDQYRYSNTLGRLPSLTYAQYGALKTIKYPTGGTSLFEYELNDYSQYQQVALNDALGNSGTVSLATVANTSAGGLRIKRITNDAGYASPPVVKEYYYTKDYVLGGTTSSGILSRRNKFIENLKFTNLCSGTNKGYSTVFSDNEFEPYGQDVKYVGYSEVTEKNGTEGYTVYKYTNFDNTGGLDEIHLPYTFMYGAVQSDRFQLTSNDLERGLLLSKEIYNSSSVKVQDEIYTYDYDPNRKQQYAKCIERLDASHQKIVSYAQYGISGICNEEYVARLYPFLKYYYNIPLKQVTKNSYLLSGTVSEVKTFKYDAYGNTIESSQSMSDGSRIVQRTKFNSHTDYITNNAVSADALGVRNLFYNYGIKNAPIEQTKWLYPGGTFIPVGSETITGATLWQYLSDIPFVYRVSSMELAAPFQPVTYLGTTPTSHYITSAVNSSGNFVVDDRYIIQSTINNFSTSTFSSLIKPLGVSNLGAKNIAYTWDYRMEHICSETQGVGTGITAFTSFEGEYFVPGLFDDSRGNWNFDKSLIISDGIAGSKCFNLTAGVANNIVSTYVVPNGVKHILSFWAKGAFPVLLNGTVSFGSGSTTSGWTYYEFSVAGSNQPIVIKSQGTTAIDEIKLYPYGSSMNSYTYDILGNMTTVDDPKGRISYYTYDSMGRLIAIRDAQGNIVKSYSYRVQQ